MKRPNWILAVTGAGLVALALLILAILPAIGQNTAPEEKPPVGLEQAQELSVLATQLMRDGNYKDAIHALKSAAFVLEEGIGAHMGGPGMMPPMQMGQMPGGPQMGRPGMSGPMMGPGPGPGNQDFLTALERIRTRANEIQNAGADIGDIPDRLASAEKAFSEDRPDEAWQILQAVNADLDRIKQEFRQSQGG
jgi:hypothetical protein